MLNKFFFFFLKFLPYYSLIYLLQIYETSSMYCFDLFLGGSKASVLETTSYGLFSLFCFVLF